MPDFLSDFIRVRLIILTQSSNYLPFTLRILSEHFSSVLTHDTQFLKNGQEQANIRGVVNYREINEKNNKYFQCDFLPKMFLQKYSCMITGEKTSFRILVIFHV